MNSLQSGSTGKTSSNDHETFKRSTEEKLRDINTKVGALKSQVDEISGQIVSTSEIKLLIDAELDKFFGKNLSREEITNLISAQLSSSLGGNYITEYELYEIIDRKLSDHNAKLVDNIRSEIGVQITEELNRYIFRDAIGKPDYALYEVGGRVKDYTGKYNLGNLFSTDPNIILHTKSNNNAGDCWKFSGQSAYIVIQLSESIYPESITLDHISASISQDIDATPRKFKVQVFIICNLILIFRAVLMIERTACLTGLQKKFPKRSAFLTW